MAYELSLQDFTAKNIYPLGQDFRGKNNKGEELSFTSPLPAYFTAALERLKEG